jgi:hypothetical protein
MCTSDITQITGYSRQILIKSYNFLDRVSKNTQISNFTKIRPVGAVFFHADKQKDRRTDRNTDRTKLIITFRKSGEERLTNKLPVHGYRPEQTFSATSKHAITAVNISPDIPFCNSFLFLVHIFIPRLIVLCIYLCTLFLVYYCRF